MKEIQEPDASESFDKCLSEKEWKEQKAPIYWLKIDGFSSKDDIMQDIIKKWIDQNNEEWWYHDYQTFAFGSLTDRASFKMHLTCDAFDEDEDYGELV